MSDPTPPSGQEPAEAPSVHQPPPQGDPQAAECPGTSPGDASQVPLQEHGAGPAGDESPPQAPAPGRASQAWQGPPADSASADEQPCEADEAASSAEIAGSAAPQADAPQAPQADQEAASALPAIVVRYGLMRSVGQFSYDMETAPRPGSHVVVRTERGVELGLVLACVGDHACQRCISHGQLRDFLRDNGPEYVFPRGGKVLRQANSQDVIDQRHLDGSAVEERAFCRQQIRQMGLPMKAICVEHLLGGERIIFYFSAETRVDFRDLVRHLASQYRTRIEMRQVGARDEARLVADYERCGQQCCCQTYLKDLKPVSMRMAKTQKATLDPAKISGRCGRLMCCLRYEDATYEELRKHLPPRNTWVRTEKLVGKVVEGQIITQLVRLLLPDNTLVVVANEEIIERNVIPPPMGMPIGQAARPAPFVRQRPRAQAPAAPDEATDVVQAGDAGQSVEPDFADAAQVSVPSDDQGQGVPPPADEASEVAEPSRSGPPAGEGRGRRRGRRGRCRDDRGPGGLPSAGPQSSAPGPKGPDDRPAQPSEPAGAVFNPEAQTRRAGGPSPASQAGPGGQAGQGQGRRRRRRRRH